MRACFCIAVLVVVGSHPVLAQTSPAAAGPRLATSWTETWEPAPVAPSYLGNTSTRALSRGTKWALGGALVVGILSAAVANALCEHRECTGPTLKWGVIGAASGAALGGLIAVASD
jgi:hypothetical protein